MIALPRRALPEEVAQHRLLQNQDPIWSADSDSSFARQADTLPALRATGGRDDLAGRQDHLPALPRSLPEVDANFSSAAECF